MDDDEFNFVAPPECPVFRPSREEWMDPLAYIDQIKPVAVKSGICKIIPPDGWKPPFSVDVNTFQFTPRVQKLYELEAQSRVKLNFMTKLSQFVRLQGNDKLKVPNINGHHVDLYKLHKYVNEAGGYEHVTANKLWIKIGFQLGYKTSNQAYTLRMHYEKIILPYDIMTAGTKENSSYDSLTTLKPKPVLHPSTTKKRKSLEILPIDPLFVESNTELKKLQFVGAGPLTFNGTKEEIKLEDERMSGPLKRKCLSDYVCKVCCSGDREDRLLICDNDDCQDCFHCECLVPPIVLIPKQSWKCHNCVLKVLNTKPVEYGFPSSVTTYTLYEFGRSADRFKANYFGKELHELVPCNTVEKEFWRILQSFNDDVIVEYGADIHSSHQGSGFPTFENISNGKCARNNGELNMDLAIKYAKDSWNLNNLPVNKRSILSYIRGNIDGMKVPWCYVGMVFSSFCWHIEDHWSFSINYLHWGEPKTWYGVSSENAVEFETAMKKQAPELFDNHEDLLHHITTTMNPNILQQEGVPVYRTDQHAGQFVVTFPRAYHAGFNQGFNFAEAVNFCPAYWLPMGRACISHYAQLHRHCVFSHEELLCTIAEAALLEQDNIPDDKVVDKYPLIFQLGLPRSQINIDTNIRRVVHSELDLVLEEEIKCRIKLKKLGVIKYERRLFENMNDDERACAVCQTTCFLSAVQCLCYNDNVKNEFEEPMTNIKRIVCFRHIDDICNICPGKECIFLYRFEVDEIKLLLSGLEVRLQDFHSWESSIKDQFTEGPVSCDENVKRCSLEQLQIKLDEGAECGFDSCDEYVKARGLLERGINLTNVCKHWLRAIQESEDCSKMNGNDLNMFHVPKSVLVDCVHEDGSVEIKNINVACLNQENLSHMSQTLLRFPVRLPCSQFEQMVSRLLQWQNDSHLLMETTLSNPAVLLPKVVQLFEEAKRLFPGWTAFANERTCLMLSGKSLQWLVRIRECEDAVKSGKTAHLDKEENMLSLPQDLVKDSTLVDMVNHGETLITSLKATISDLGDIGKKFLCPVSNSIELALTALYEVMGEVNRIREESIALPKRGLSSQVLSSLKSATEHCLCMGVRIKELDEARVRIYKSCVEAIVTNKPGRYVALQHATLVLQLGSALFSEAVIDRDNGQLTQKHLAAKAQLSLINRGVRKLKIAYTGCSADHDPNYICSSGCNDADFLRILIPRFYSTDAIINRDRLAHNSAQFLHMWLSSTANDNQIISLMTLYQSLMVEELASLDKMITINTGTISDELKTCHVCNRPINENLHLSKLYCDLCAPRSKQPTISDMAQLNKLLKQCPNIVSVYGIALQALSKRIVTWLESLVTVIRVNARYLSRFYLLLKDDQINIPICIKEIFTQAKESVDKMSPECTLMAKELVSNLKYLGRVGHCLEVNVESYLNIILALCKYVERDLLKASH